jgi:hypothetical protein
MQERDPGRGAGYEKQKAQESDVKADLGIEIPRASCTSCRLYYNDLNLLKL